ncbi:fungal-specific transcription factor domain-containing protein [Xylaria intraflava]|nr:fungal-specific transcription factor domain-containing protein [Xylaria intraflava]
MFMTLNLDKRPKRAAKHDNTAARLDQIKRKQVHRACDWCKLMRVRCNDERPCSHCRRNGRECKMSGKTQFRSMAAAVKEVESLRAQVRSLEERKNRSREESKSSTSSSTATSRGTSLNDLYRDRQSASRNGVRIGPIVYGMVSFPFFLTRLSQFLETTRPQLKLDLITAVGCPGIPAWLPADAGNASYLSAQQEAHSLALFWQAHYFSFPILNERQFRKEYQALVAESGPGVPRKASPLVDIILALCFQLGSFNICHASRRLPSCGGPPEPGRAPLAGFQYYQRCQEAIDRSIETPSVTTVQCYIFSIVYLYEAGLMNLAQVTLGKGVSLATLLGLPNEPPSSDPEPEREVSRRTWWSLYALDVMISMEVGRSPMIGHTRTTCSPPSDSDEFARWLAPHYKHDEACPSWLGFQSHTLRLLQLTSSVRSRFCDKYDHVVGEDGYEAFVNSGDVRERCASFLTEPMRELAAWARDVPEGYYAPRKEGEPFSTKASVLDLDANADILVHCQRQRLLLELQYHHKCMNLYQPFICFVSTIDMSTPLSDSKAAAGLGHAIAMTSMIHQAVTTSDVLNGVYSVLRWQRAALFYMIGYAYSFPFSGSRAAIFKTVDMAIAVVDRYAGAQPQVCSTAVVARALAADAASIVSSFHAGDDWLSSTWLGTPASEPTSAFDLDVMEPLVATAPAAMQSLFGGVTHTVDMNTPGTTTSPTTVVDPNELFNPGPLPAFADLGGSWDDTEMMWSSMASFETE